MIPYIRYSQTNWVDGMKVNKDHFISLENNLISKYQDAIALQLNSHNYGILPGHAGKPSYDLTIDVDKNNLLRVNIHELRAITNAGIRIEISSDNSSLAQNSAFAHEIDVKSLSGTAFYVVLSVNPFGRVPVGNPDPEEVPPRYPYADYSYSVNVVNADELSLPSSGYFHLCVGKVIVVGNRCELDNEYIPPCAAIQSHPDLIQFYEHLDKMLTKLELDCTAIIQKIYSKQQNNVLPESVLYLTEAVIQYLNGSLTDYRWFYKEKPPVFLLSYFNALARVIKNTIDLKSGDGKEQMLNYFKSWIVEVNQGEFEQTLTDMINVQYNHLEIAECLEKLDSFYKTVNIVFSKLAKLDYIGEVKRTNVIIKTEEAQDIPQKKNRNFIIK